MLHDIITEIGEERDMIGNEAVKDFFVDLWNHCYDYVRLRESIAELKAEKAQLSVSHATNYVSSKIESSKNILADDQVIYYVKTFSQRTHCWDN
jgi:hypothetical protein